MTARREGCDEVYPRVCGGTALEEQNTRIRRGLSPRVRGNRMTAVRMPPGMRSIPACAGEPAGPAGVHEPRGVYPRVCGGTGNVLFVRVRRYGLSPRVRGNHEAWMGPNGRQRSIPACAGEPGR